MNDYLGILGLACVNADFRNDLFEFGAEVVERRHLAATHTPDLDSWLDTYKNASAGNKDAGREAFAAAGNRINAVCQRPPCKSFDASGNPVP